MSTTDTSVISNDTWLSYLSSIKNTILSLRINLNQFAYPISSIFARLHRLDLRISTDSQKLFHLNPFIQLKALSIVSTSNKSERIKGLASSIWNSDSSLETLSISNCFILDKDDFYPRSSCSLIINRHLTRLSVDLTHICFAIVLMPLVPALEYFELRLHDIYNKSSAFNPEFLQSQQWPRKVKSLRFIAYDQLMDTVSFCTFVKRFSLSLEHLSFYISTHHRFLMSGSGSLERHLLSYLSHLKQLDFCVHSGIMNIEIDRRRTFDRWTKKQVISIFHLHQYHTRFTIPFVFDRLEYVSNDLLDYHCNYYQSNVTLSLTTVRTITLRSYNKLDLALFTFMQQTCPSLRHLRFKDCCKLNDDLVQDTKLTLLTIIELCLNDITDSIDFTILQRLLSLTPNLKYLTVQRHHMTIINNMNSNVNLFEHIKVTIVESSS